MSPNYKEPSKKLEVKGNGSYIIEYKGQRYKTNEVLMKKSFQN